MFADNQPQSDNLDKSLCLHLAIGDLNKTAQWTRLEVKMSPFDGRNKIMKDPSRIDPNGSEAKSDNDEISLIFFAISEFPKILWSPIFEIFDFRSRRRDSKRKIFCHLINLEMKLWVLYPLFHPPPDLQDLELEIGWGKILEFWFLDSDNICFLTIATCSNCPQSTWVLRLTIITGTNACW